VRETAGGYGKLAGHAVVGWALCAFTMFALLHSLPLTLALLVRAIAAPTFFVALAWHYFRARGARDPLPTAVMWTAIVGLLDIIVIAGLVLHSLEMFRSIAGTWLPLSLIPLATWVTGEVLSRQPRGSVVRA